MHRVERYLDAGHGACWLRRPEIAGLVENALLHFDGARYRLIGWVLMPNHLHLLVETREGFGLHGIVQSWKSFTARQANALLQRSGPFWARDYFDRYIRDDQHLSAVLHYIDRNPVQAGLVAAVGDWPHGSARFAIGANRR
jgi:REP element-mobilizing transposase RayT